MTGRLRLAVRPRARRLVLHLVDRRCQQPGPPLLVSSPCTLLSVGFLMICVHVTQTRADNSCSSRSRRCWTVASSLSLCTSLPICVYQRTLHSGFAIANQHVRADLFWLVAAASARSVVVAKRSVTAYAEPDKVGTAARLCAVQLVTSPVCPLFALPDEQIHVSALHDRRHPHFVHGARREC